jgi:hypothetical protein
VITCSKSKSLQFCSLTALITGGSFYTLENTGEGPMIMMGNRSGPADKIQIIDYVTRKDIREKVQADFNG